MSREAILNFQCRVRGLKKAFENNHLPSIERTHAKLKSLPDNEFEGQGRELMTEAQIKTCLLDPILSSLEWDLTSLDSMLVEAPVEPLTSEKNRRFLDYHGCEIGDDAQERSLLVIEAKRPNVSLPGNIDKSSDLLVKDILDGLKWISSGKSKKCGLTADWVDRLETLSDYVKRVHATFGHTPSRTVITNGEWYIIFINPENTFISSVHSVEDVKIFKNLDDVENRANEFYYNIAYSSLSKRIPPQHPSGLINFIKPDDTIYVTQAIEIIFQDLRAIQPIIAIRLFARVRTQKKVWILIQKEYNPVYEVLNQKSDKVTECLLTIEEYSNSLLAELSNQAKLILLTSVEYEKMMEDDDVETKWDSSYLCEKLTGNVFNLITGNHSFPFTNNSDFCECPYHNFGNCLSSGNAAGSTAILSPSLSPRAYFPSGSAFHCAHKSVHILREKKCVILAIDSYICCQRCIFFQRCWPDGGFNLPCVNNII